MKAVAQKEEEIHVSQEEIKRRVEFYCEEAYKQQAMPHVIYQDPFIVCPWPDCDHRMGGIDFQIEKKGDPAFYQQVVTAFWKGDGIVGNCPDCGKPVIFSPTEKRRIEDENGDAWVVLPEDWHEKAYIMN